MIWGYWDILHPKYYLRKTDKIYTNTLNYIFSSCITICTKMFKSSHYIYIYIYCLQEESPDFGIKVLTNFCLEILKQSGLNKKHGRKVGKIHKDFWIIPSLHMSQNDLIPANHILLKCTKSIFITFNQSLLSINFITKNWFCSFFSSSDKHQSQYLVRCHPSGINSLLMSF